MMHKLLAPVYFFKFAKKMKPWLIVLFTLTIIYGLVGGLIIAPADYLQGDGFRIIYIHVPCAFLSIFIYTIMAGSAALGLIFRLKLAFLVMRESAVLGAGFTFLALLTGSLWGKPMWGTWWLWDARLTSELILLFLYLGILLFQSAMIHKNHGDRASAILILVGFIDIPIIHFSVYWWNTLHQGSTLKLLSPSTIAPTMLHPLIAMIVAFTMYYFIVLLMRMQNSWVLVKDNKS